MTRNPRTHDMIAAGPAIDDASHAPNSQPDPIKELTLIRLIGID